MLHLNPPSYPLRIDVAEGTAQRAQRRSDRNIPSIDSEVYGILNRSVSAWRIVVKGDGASNGILAVGQVLVLPDPPCTVDLGVVEPF